jgi:hypothetical protein
LPPIPQSGKILSIDRRKEARILNFDEIFLLPNEINLLREMLDEKPRSMRTPGMDNLRQNDLVSWMQNSSVKDDNNWIITMYSINVTGKRFLQYYDHQQSELLKVNKHAHIMDILTIVGVIASIIAAIASVISVIK